jgi:delta 1-pyrroline-5-carboxylate dehydrogenase
VATRPLLATDVGPVIDGEAFEGIGRQLTRLRRDARDLLGDEPKFEAKSASSPII